MKKIIFAFFLCLSPLLRAEETLIPIEAQIVGSINKNSNDALKLLEKVVNINSGTNNLEGIYKVGKIFQAEFEKLGFKGEWEYQPDEMKRAGTLVLKREGSQGKKVLLIAHVDTVFPKNSDFQYFTREGNLATGPGVADDKGGIVLILYALKALHEQGALDNTTITITLIGDEEDSAKPTSISRAPLLAAAKNMDVALDFEPSSGIETATIARRGISNWQITSTGMQAHSSTLFKKPTGDGAIFELTRILNEIREKFSGEPYITFNPGEIIGGTEATIENNTGNMTGYGKNNVVAAIAMAKGDMRFLSSEEEEYIKRTATRISKKSLEGTSSVISFQEAIPAMPPTSANENLLEIYSEVSTDLGYPRVEAVPVDQRGAADISHIASIVPANLAGLGPVGNFTHTVNERVDIESLNINTQRAALLIYRLTRED